MKGACMEAVWGKGEYVAKRDMCGEGGLCVEGKAGMHGRGHAWQGLCMAGEHAWKERQPLQWAVRILLWNAFLFSF